MRRIPST